MTSIFQPLDRCIIFPLKKYLKLKYVEFLLGEQKIKESIDESRIRIIDNNIIIWTGYKDGFNNEEYIGKVLIEKSFKITGITNNIDGSEDIYFDGFDIINQLVDLKEKNENNIQQNNNNIDTILDEGGEYEVERESDSEER